MNVTCNALCWLIEFIGIRSACVFQLNDNYFITNWQQLLLHLTTVLSWICCFDFDREDSTELIATAIFVSLWLQFNGGIACTTVNGNWVCPSLPDCCCRGMFSHSEGMLSPIGIDIASCIFLVSR
jgi:hypothetical protein